jgi:hypothetical protein
LAHLGSSGSTKFVVTERGEIKGECPDCGAKMESLNRGPFPKYEHFMFKCPKCGRFVQIRIADEKDQPN